MAKLQKVNFFAPAKINLFLYVLYRRKDGYHEISSLIVPVSLFDIVRISRQERGIEVICNGMFDVPDGRENIAFRAAELFFDYFSLTGGVRIDIEKNIPVGAGLGGGSSDAAAVLKGMSILFLGELHDGQILELASRIGADVPFFLYPVSSKVSGRGEILKRIHFKKRYHILIVKPGVSVSTRFAYQELDRMDVPIRFDPELSEDIESIDDLRGYFHNDFEDLVFKMHPEVKELKERLLSLGADGALLSGSGSSVFGLFGRKEGAAKAQEEFAGHEGLYAKLVNNF